MQTAWDFLNSPIGVALIAGLMGGILANWLASRWQLRAKRYEMQLHAYERVLSTMIKWADSAIYGDERQQFLSYMEFAMVLTLLASLCQSQETRDKLDRFDDAIEKVYDAKAGHRGEEWERQKVERHAVVALNAVISDLGMKPVDDIRDLSPRGRKDE